MSLVFWMILGIHDRMCTHISWICLLTVKLVDEYLQWINTAFAYLMQLMALAFALTMNKKPISFSSFLSYNPSISAYMSVGWRI